ncbi:type II toxin-antitoxin system RelE/ParE family toxin [Salinispira pacifica]|uniref:Death on curing protein, Doc toxin n=1 Tax=Salinispira pacifica TaxID=1307761 RepID=V5WHY7_9SPIO|nr:type II toxin-antitoxin system RelE/ParE family toxin [Salinispira pacifica]AHC15442.1 Death on curing protein, Doc toxin [Salinispira pacifica]
MRNFTLSTKFWEFPTFFQGSHKIFWTKTAVEDLEEIIEYISIESIDIAIKQYEKIKAAASKLDSFPDRGRIIPELQKQNIYKYRELIIGPWRVMYKIEDNKVYILAVIDGRRNIEEILMKRHLR